MPQISSFWGFIQNYENQATEFHLGKFQALLNTLKNQVLREKKINKNIKKNTVIYHTEFFKETRNRRAAFVTNTLN